MTVSLSEYPKAFALRPYQKAAIKAIRGAIARKVHRQLLVMATGLGKTVVISHVAARAKYWGPGHRFLGLMHRDELLGQAQEKLRSLNPSRKIDIERGSLRAADDADIVLASVQTLARPERLARFAPGDFSKIWIDEVHHAPARSYIEILKHFGLYDNAKAGKLLLGTTATPERLDKLGYDRLFDDVVFRYGLRDGIQDGWLADLACFRVRTHIDLSKVRMRAGEFVESDLARAVDISERNAQCLQAYRERGRGRRNLVFCVTKDHARNVAGLFEKAGVPVGVILDETSAEDRRRRLEEFRAGHLEVLVNVTILTEGIDIPEVEVIHLLRPTHSLGLLLQMIGRGTRKAPRKDRCLVFDYADDLGAKELATVGKIFNLPDSFDFAGESVISQVEEIRALEADFGTLPLEEMTSLESIRIHFSKIDPLRLYGAVPPEVEDHSSFRWIKRRADSFFISWSNPRRNELDHRDDGQSPWIAREREILDKEKLWGVAESLEISVNQLGKWELTRHFGLRGGRSQTERLAFFNSTLEAFEEADGWIGRKRPYVVQMMDRRAEWNRQPATPRQIDALLRKGYPRDSLMADGGRPMITKGDASGLMLKPLPRFLSRKSKILDRPSSENKPQDPAP